MTGLTLSGNQLIISFIILGIIVLLVIIFLKEVLKLNLLKSTTKYYSIRRRVKSLGADSLQLRSPILKFSFLIALSFVFFAFSWTIKHTPIENYKVDNIDEYTLEITPPRIKITKELPVIKKIVRPKIPIIIPDILIKHAPKFIPDRVIPPTMSNPSIGTADTLVTSIPSPPPLPFIKEDEPPILLAEQMPRFPGCESIIGSNATKKKCADQKLLDYIYNNIKYPSIARENRIEGTVIVRFTVNRKGGIVNTTLLRDPGAELGTSVIKLVKSMNNLGEHWTPGKQQGRPVSVLYTLPIKFKLK
jgi:protein TonB